MAQQRVITSLVVVLAFACVANAGFAQTQATTTSGPQTSGDQVCRRRWPSRRVIRSPVVGRCSYSRTTIGRRCPAAMIILGCRAICCSSR